MQTARSNRASVILLVLGIGLIMPTFIGLGVWQLARLAERRALNAHILARVTEPPLTVTGQIVAEVNALEYRHAVARGVYDFSQEIVLKNRAHQQQPGGHVLTPLRLVGSDIALLVDRGWIPYQQTAADARRIYQYPAAEIEVRGILRLSQAQSFAFLPADPPLSSALPRLDDWFWVNLDQIQGQIPYPLWPVFLEAEASAVPLALPVAGYALELTEGAHLNYALQWFALAGIALVGPLAYWRQQRRQSAAQVHTSS